MGVIAGIAAAAAVGKALVDVKNTLEEFDDDRSVVIIVANYTDYTFRVVSHDHLHGGFAVNPTSEIPPQSVDTYGSKDKGFWTGTEGWVRYKPIGLDPDIRVSISWNNPYAGSNSCDASAFKRGAPTGGLFGIRLSEPTNAVRVTHSCGAGNEKAEMRFEIRPPE